MPRKRADTRYKAVSVICKTEEFTVSRALSPDGSHVLTRVPARSQPQTSTTVKLEHEYDVARALDPDSSIRALSVESGVGTMALVLEDFDCLALIEELTGPLDLGRYIEVAPAVTAALAAIHRQGVVHKDIKPENIFLASGNSDGSVRAKLTGFGVATASSHERQAPDPPELIAGTLAYMAPEQTGRMNRSIDSRSDLYSLGVTFYQMLAGQLPFTATDAMEWVYCHIALQPPPLSQLRTDIPTPLSDIIRKLLAKNAEDRYQTAEGLKADLEHCATEWRERGGIAPFQLGTRDVPDHLLIPEKLYGRERDVETLLAAFDRIAAGGRPELVLVSGYAGVGKSAVVLELHKALVPPRGLLASGKFDQYKRGIPYSTLAQAFERLIHSLLGKSEAEFERWRQSLQEALEPNGQLIANLVPELKLIIGEQPPVSELEPQKAKARFQLLLRRFIGVFARREHPLALFLDDLQWLDAATLDLIEDLVNQQDVRYLLLIGAYRDNEVGPAHPLMRKLSAIRQAGATVKEIALAPLALDALTQLIADSLRCKPERAAPLAQLVHQKTGGNPFFAIQFLSAIAQEGLIEFDYGERRWSWDLGRIQAKGYADNVADLMARKLTRLSRRALSALQKLSCLGNVAGTPMLSHVLDVPEEEEVHAALREAVQQELVQRLDDSYRFVHDRVQEAAYSSIPEGSRAEAHLSIGRLLLAHTPEEKREEAIFEIVNQLNRGRASMTSTAEREELARLNLIAGMRAKTSTAYVSALAHLATGAALLAEDCWERKHELAFALEIGRAETEFLTGEFAVVEQRLTALTTRAAGTIERAAITCLRMDLCTTLDQSDRSVAAGLEYLRHLSVEWPPHPTKEEARRAYEQVRRKLGSRSTEELLDLPLMSDPVSLATLDVLTRLMPAAFLTDPNLNCLVACKAVALSFERGNSYGSCDACVSLGIVADLFGDYSAGFRFGDLGYELVEKRGLKRGEARIYQNFAAFVMPWTKPVRACRSLLRRAHEIANRAGDLTFAGYSCHNLVSNLLLAGDPLVEVEHEADYGIDFGKKAQFGMVIDIITSQRALIRTLRGQTPKFGSYDDVHFEERRFEGRLSSNPNLALAECWHWVRKLQARFFAGDYPAAIDASMKAQAFRMWPGLWANPLEVAELHFYGALARAACLDSAQGDQRREPLEALAAHQRQLETVAKHCPENFENRASLVKAEVARIEGRALDAMDHYEKAIQSARANGFVHNEALAHELASRFYFGRGMETSGLAHLREARACYALWGADGKVRQLDERHPQLSVPGVHPAAAGAAPALQQLDVASMVNASQAVSSEIELRRLIEMLMTIALENAGADRGLLILPEGPGFRVEVEAKVRAAEVEVKLAPSAFVGAEYPGTIVNYVIRAQESVILDDASRPGEFFGDVYLRRGSARSVFCLPLLRQGTLAGVLYLENTHAAGAFTADRVAVLDVLAAQAAISLENARFFERTKALNASLEQQILERRRAEKALRASEERFRELVQSAPEAILVFDYARGRFVSANAHAELLFGRSLEELTGLGPQDLFGSPQPDGRPVAESLRENTERALGGEAVVFERILRDARGREVILEVRLARLPFGNGKQVRASYVDITERKRIENAVRESERRLTLLIQAAPVGIVIHADDGRVLQSNPAAGRLLGVSEAEMGDRGLACPAWKFIREDGTAMPVEEYPAAQVLARHEPLKNVVVGVRRLVGEDVGWMLVDAVPLPGPGGGTSEVIVMLMDVTERKRAEEQLRQDARRKDEFLAMLGHELRNPLAPIQSASQILKLVGSPDPRAQRAREMIERQVRHISRLVDDLLDVARIARGKISLRHERLDWVKLVRTTTDDLRSELEARGMALSLHLPVRPVFVSGDPTRLAQVMGNLLQNAMKFSNRGGRVAVELRGGDGGGPATLAVRDTGIGMSRETLERAFSPFFQANTDLARSRGGMGLGLALVKGIVVLHGGTVGAASEGPGRGACITVQLPEIEAPPEAPRLLPASSARAARSILVVEDNLDAARSLQLVLELMGHRVRVAADGPSGVVEARAFRPEIVVCDIGLPGPMDGYAVARALRADPALRTARLIALTGYGQEQDRTRALEVGFDAHLTKPADAALVVNS